MSIPAECGPAILGAAALVFGLALNWWSDHQFKRKYRKIHRGMAALSASAAGGCCKHSW